jgi:hypothetical protein
MTEKLKPCPPAFQALSNAMMTWHQNTAGAAQSARDVMAIIPVCIAVLQSDTKGDFLIADAGEIQRRVTIASAIEFESRSIHALMSQILKKYGYELPVVLTRGPGGR